MKTPTPCLQTEADACTSRNSICQMTLPPVLNTAIRQILQEQFSGTGDLVFYPVSGGSINEAFRLVWGEKTVFCKINSASKFPQLFSKEAAGLRLLAGQRIIHTPTVIDCFEAEDYQVLLLDWIAEGSRTGAFWKTFGEQLAHLHQTPGNHFGLNEDNYMGSVPQQNTPYKSWIPFFMEQRLQSMISRCAARNLLQSQHLLHFEALQKKLAGIFEDEPACLLHGDLWSGNFMCNRNEEPVLIDPAVYYGHRSMDLAMTTLFGGFATPFYESYHYHYPFPASYKEQWEVCNLYPLLIHLYLFGSGYLPQIEKTLHRFA